MDRSGRSGHEQLSALLVDDESSTCPGRRDSLNALGYHVIKATDPAVALTIAKQTTLRIIFASIGQGGSGAAPFLQALRSNDSTRHIPVSLLSEAGDRRLERLGLKRIGRELW
jgi:PleD family two-component response regulator